MRRALSIPAGIADVACLAVMALTLFGAWMHWAIVDPRNIGWLLIGDDRGQNSLGLIAYLRARPAWPSLHDPALMAPDGLSLALTDSNPLLGLVLRPFSGWLLPDRWQYAGLWLLACVALQVAFAWRLLRPFTADRVAALAGTVLLAGTPVFFARYGHLNLCAQWLILWSLGLFVDPRNDRRPLRWGSVAALAWLIHPYLAVMVAAVWGSACLRLAATARRESALPLAGMAATALAVATVPFLTGLVGEPLASTGSYGRFGMALDALWNPGRDGYSALLPAASVSPAQGFEGMNYLGAGLIALAIWVVVARRSASSAVGPSLRTLWWLLPACAILGGIAIGPTPVWRGQVLADLPLPRQWRDLLDPLRASGRMFWPAYYTIVLAIVAGACRRRDARVALVAALALQAIDIGPMLVVIHRITDRAEAGQAFVRTRDPRWPGIIASASSVEIHPFVAYRDLSLVEEVAWRAIGGCCVVPLRWFYASREPQAIRTRLAEDERRLAAGIVDPTRLYVLIDPPPAAVADRARRIDGAWVIAPSRPRPRCVSRAPSSPRSAS